MRMRVDALPIVAAACWMLMKIMAMLIPRTAAQAASAHNEGIIQGIANPATSVAVPICMGTRAPTRSTQRPIRMEKNTGMIELAARMSPTVIGDADWLTANSGMATRPPMAAVFPGSTIVTSK